MFGFAAERSRFRFRVVILVINAPTRFSFVLLFKELTLLLTCVLSDKYPKVFIPFTNSHSLMYSGWRAGGRCRDGRYG